MPKVLLISGSPRVGNTDFVLRRIYDSLKLKDKQIIFLKDKNINHCLGCLACDKTNKCVINDDMAGISQELNKSDIIIIGTPNYFDNVSGLLKDFIDRTNPFYDTESLKGKKIINIVVGGQKIFHSKRVVDGALAYFISAHKMKLVDSYCFQALMSDDLKKSSTVGKTISLIVDRIMAEAMIKK